MRLLAGLPDFNRSIRNTFYVYVSNSTFKSSNLIAYSLQYYHQARKCLCIYMYIYIYIYV